MMPAAMSVMPTTRPKTRAGERSSMRNLLRDELFSIPLFALGAVTDHPFGGLARRKPGMAGDTRDLADEEVMQLVQREDPRAFELLYDRHGGAAYSLAYRIVGRQSAAEDVVQEALLSIWRSRLRYD